MPGSIAFGHGLGVTLDFDGNAFRDTEVFLLDAMLERFLARYMSINSFTGTVLHTNERGEVMRWQMEPGNRSGLRTCSPEWRRRPETATSSRHCGTSNVSRRSCHVSVIRYGWRTIHRALGRNPTVLSCLRP